LIEDSTKQRLIFNEPEVPSPLITIAEETSALAMSQTTVVQSPVTLSFPKD